MLVGSVLHVLANRHIVAEVAEGVEVDLRPPNVGEWREVVKAYQEADRGWREEMLEWVAEVERTGDPKVPQPARLQYLFGEEGAPYAAAFLKAIQLLSTTNTSFEADKLPSWAGEPEAFKTFYDTWRKVTVTKEAGEPDLTPSLAALAAMEPPESGAGDADAQTVLFGPKGTAKVGG